MVALAPLFLAAVLPSQVTRLVCRFSGATMEAEACCPTQDSSRPDQQLRFRDEACCSLIVSDLPTLLSEQSLDPQFSRADQPAAVASFAAVQPARSPLVERRGRCAANYRPPPLTLKRALLI